LDDSTEPKFNKIIIVDVFQIDYDIKVEII
jgi:hypothetical protein